ncbi:MAG: Ig-like domain-containing protein [Longimicrobiales bacterium]
MSVGPTPRALPLALLAVFLACESQVVTVAEVATVEITLTAPVISVGDTVRASATAREESGLPVEGVDLTWSTQDPGVAGVDATGLVFGVGAGTTEIEARVGAVVGSLSIDVAGRPVGEVRLAPDTLQLEVQEQETLTALVWDDQGTPLIDFPVVWASNDQQIATVDQEGRVAAVASGATEVRATADGTVGVATIFVTAEAGVVIVNAETSGDPGQSDYTVSVAGQQRSLPVDGTTAFGTVPPGSRSVRLQNVPDNCEVKGGNPRTLTVVAGGVAQTTFEVECEAGGGPTGAYGATVLADGPVAYFKLDDGGSTQSDEVAGFDLTSVGSPTTGSPGIVSGTENLAVAFDNDRLSNSAPISNGAGSLTIEAWFSPGAGFAGAGEVNIVNLFGTAAGGAADNLVLGTVNAGDSIGAAGTIRLRGYIFEQGEGGRAYVNGPELTVGTIYHLVLRYQNSNKTLQLFVDGTAVDEQTTGHTVDWNDQTLHVGGAPHLGSRNAVGTIDEVAIYRKALSPARILAHFLTGS